MTSIIKVNNLQNQCGANIINENAGTITIGASGDTVTLAAGASQSGFGRSGSVNWDTTPKTTGFTAVSGNGYFCDTTSAAFTVTLPLSPSAGDIVAIADYANTAATNNITVGRNSSKIDGETEDAVILINGQVYTLVYVDATEGWKTVGQTFNQITVPQYIVASGGTVTCCGDYKIHTFTGPGTFTVCSVGNPFGSTTVDYLVVAGGGGGGAVRAGGGGAGGFRESVPSPAAWTASPLASPGGALPVSVQGYPITVGGGGVGGTSCGQASNMTNGTSGNNSIFSTITSAGGGNGNKPCGGGSAGGSGGGGVNTPSPGTGMNGNTPPTSPPQGNNGGTGVPGPGYGAGGGGGATAVGVNGSGSTGGNGGAGGTTSISGSPLAYSGGGGASFYTPSGTPGTGGSSVGGNGANSTTPATAGTTNRGGGGGGGWHNCTPVSPGALESGAAGGSGIVIIRYKFQ
jgi:hypothetical protein